MNFAGREITQNLVERATSTFINDLQELKLPPHNRLVSDFAMKLIKEEKAILIKKDDWDSYKNSAIKNFV